ncbi:MAG: GNAT family N-acetyltransferase [Acidimicrobiales bacterium]
MQRLASRCWPDGLHPGGLGWALAIGQLATDIVLADDGDLLGWAGLSSGELVVQVDPSRPEAARSLVCWALEVAVGKELTVSVADGDEVVCSAVLEAGFSCCGDAAPIPGMVRDASPEGPRLQAGYRVRSIRAGEFTRRVQVHRAAWRPSTLPWPAEVLPTVSPDATSTFTEAHYAEVRRTLLYDPSLDLVIEAPDGTLAACCIAWWDKATGCAEIEPLGVVPEHRRRGLATALCMEVAARVAARHGDKVFINTGPRADYPAPAATYASVGFEVVTRAHRYHREATEHS